MTFSRDSCSDAAVAACPAGIALPTDSARERRMYHCAMVGPKVLNAVAAVNAPLACSAVVATCLPILAELRRDRHTEVAEEDTFLIRTLLIHDCRRLLLRDPELPDVLLPAE